MIKMRLTFVNNDKGIDELNEAIEKIKNDFEILDISKVYEGRGASKFANVYIDLENK